MLRFVESIRKGKDALARIGKNIVAVSAGNIIDRGLLFVLLTIIARQLGPALYGDFITTYVFVNIAFIFSELGLVMMASREIAKDTAMTDTYCSAMLGMRTVTIPLIMAIITVILFFIDYSNAIKIGIGILSCYFGLVYLTHPFVATFIAHERNTYNALMVFADRALVTVAGLIVLLKGASLTVVEGIFVVGGLVRFVVGMRCIRTYVSNVRLTFDLAVWRSILRKSLPIGVYMIATLLYFRIDTLLLTFLGYGSTEVGWYNASYNIFAVLLLPAIAFSQAAFPPFVRLYVNNKSEFKRYFIYSVVFLLLVGIGIGVVVYAAAPVLIRILYGGNYEYSVSILKVLAVAICFSLVTWFSQRLFIAVDKIKELLLFMVGAAILNIVLNIQCIPALGAVGAAMTTMLCEVLFALYAVYYIITHIVHDDTTNPAAV